MIYLLIAILLLSANGMAKEVVSGVGAQYGTLTQAIDKAINLDNLLKSPENFKGKKVVLKGAVEKVCKQSGCWLTLKEGPKSIMTVFKDYGFTVPKDIEGKTVVCEGELIEKVTSVAEQKHFLKDAGESKEKINSIKEPKKEYNFIAEGVVIL